MQTKKIRVSPTKKVTNIRIIPVDVPCIDKTTLKINIDANSKYSRIIIDFPHLIIAATKEINNPVLNKISTILI